MLRKSKAQAEAEKDMAKIKHVVKRLFMLTFQVNMCQDQNDLERDFVCLVTEEQVRFALADEIVENDLLTSPETMKAYINQPLNQISLMLYVMYLTHNNWSITMRRKEGTQIDVCKRLANYNDVDLMPAAIIFVIAHFISFVLKYIFRADDKIRVLDTKSRVKMDPNERRKAIIANVVLYLIELVVFIIVLVTYDGVNCQPMMKLTLWADILRTSLIPLFMVTEAVADMYELNSIPQIIRNNLVI